MLNHYKARQLTISTYSDPLELLTLMRYPFTLLDCLGSRTERHEISLNNVLRVGWVKPQGHRVGQVVGAERVVAGSYHSHGL